MPSARRSALRELCDSLNVMAGVRAADDRVFVASAPRPFVAHRGWGLYRYWMGESRTATLRWADGLVQDAEQHATGPISLRDANRLLSAAHVFRKGLARLAERVYPDDAAVQEQLVPLFARTEALLTELRTTARTLARARRQE
jgi:hypothetical protein